MIHLRIKEITDTSVTIAWGKETEAKSYVVYWADADTPGMEYRRMTETEKTEYTLHKATHVPHFFKVSPVTKKGEGEPGPVLCTPVKKVFNEQIGRAHV